MNLLWVGLGGSLGAMSRYSVYLLEKKWSHGSFPIGTWIINVIGCFVAGLFLSLSERPDFTHRTFLLASTMGFIGAFTTFSTFQVELFQMVRSNQWYLMWGNFLSQIIFGFGAVWLGKNFFDWVAR